MIPIPEGYYFCSTAAGLKYTGRDDLAFIGSEVPAAAGGMFTRNRFQAAPVTVAKAVLAERETVSGILVNAGQANACTGEDGLADCRLSCDLLAEALGLEKQTILPASTGVIGDPLPMDRFARALEGLAASRSSTGPLDVAKAMMTTDSFPKLAWRTLQMAGGEIRVLGMAKGSGMICPNMATMLSFILLDAALSRDCLRRLVSDAGRTTFNRITVDGDTSTNDCVLALANGCSGISPEEGRLPELQSALTDVCRELSTMLIQDAEGGTKTIAIQVQEAEDTAQAEEAARTVAHSPLVKTAMYGQDPNWGRIVAALGRSGACFDPERVSIAFGDRPVFLQGRPVQNDLDLLLKPLLRSDSISIRIALGAGEAEATVMTSDLSPEYVKINADYRT
jgi:glutamate N-acetyltransferase/amino-acid N-acetyltransferase